MKTLLLTLAAVLAAGSLNAQTIVDFVDGDGLTNDSTSGDNLIWNITVDGTPLTLTVSSSDPDFSAWNANTSKDGFGLETTRGDAWTNAIDGDPDNNDPEVIGEAVTFTFSTAVDLGANGLKLTGQKLGLELAEEGDTTYQYEINGGGTIDGSALNNAEFNIAGSETAVTTVSVFGVAGIDGGFRPNDIEITAIPEPATAVLLLGGLGLVLAVGRRRRASSRVA